MSLFQLGHLAHLVTVDTFRTLFSVATWWIDHIQNFFFFKQSFWVFKKSVSVCQSERRRVRGVVGTRCGCRSMSEKESLVKIFSFTWATAALRAKEEDVSRWFKVKSCRSREEAGFYLWISGISGLCLNKEDVLMPPFPASGLRSGVLLSACVRSVIQKNKIQKRILNNCW